MNTQRHCARADRRHNDSADLARGMALHAADETMVGPSSDSMQSHGQGRPWQQETR